MEEGNKRVKVRPRGMTVRWGFSRGRFLSNGNNQKLGRQGMGSIGYQKLGQVGNGFHRVPEETQFSLFLLDLGPW